MSFELRTMSLVNQWKYRSHGDGIIQLRKHCRHNFEQRLLGSCGEDPEWVGTICSDLSHDPAEQQIEVVWYEALN